MRVQSLGLSFDADISSADPECAARGEALLNEALDASAGMGERPGRTAPGPGY